MTIKKHFFIYTFILSVITFSGCSDNDPKKEDVPEMITKVVLTFTGGGTQQVVTATDPDGDGVQNIKTDGTITLSKNTDYVLTLQLINGLADPGDEAYDVTKEVESESHEHQFFYSWTGNAFASPAGDGNIDNRSDALNYQDKDANNFPVGLRTNWKTIDVGTKGAKFRVLLKHQPELKSTSSSSADGETDLDITFDLEVQ